MSRSFEPILSAYTIQILKALEAAGQSLLDRCQVLRETSDSIRPEQLETLVLSAISAIQSVWNTTLSPIHRLPTEILVHIFSLVPRQYSVSSTKGSHWPFTFPAIDTNAQLATVCKHWCNLIRNTPTLWSVVSETDASHPHLPNMWALAQCPHGPLSVYVSGKVSSRMWSLLEGEGHRIQQLHITNVSADGEAMLALLQPFPANRLEHCKINMNIPINKQKRLLSLFSGDGRSLRSLYLDMASFLPSNTFPRLSRLIIDRLHCSEDPLWDLGDLLNFLRGSPQLEHLYLSWVWTQNCPHRTNIPADASSASLEHLRTFTLDLRGRLFTATLRMLLAVVKLPRTCQILLRKIALDELQAISPSLLSLERRLTRMRIALGATIQDHTGSPRWDWSLVLASSHPEDAPVRLDLIPVHPTMVPELFGPSFSKLSLFENVEELWYGGQLHEGLIRRVLLPRNVRGLALTIPNGSPNHWAGCLAQVARVGAQLDTLCICVPNAEHLRRVRDALTSRGPDGKPRCRAIRRVVVGYEKPSTRLSRGAISLQGCGAGTEISWTGRIPGSGEDGTEMERLLSVVPQVLEEPASIQTGWPTWSGFLR